MIIGYLFCFLSIIVMNYALKGLLVRFLLLSSPQEGNFSENYHLNVKLAFSFACLYFDLLAGLSLFCLYLLMGHYGKLLMSTSPLILDLGYPSLTIVMQMCTFSLWDWPTAWSKLSMPVFVLIFKMGFWSYILYLEGVAALFFH